MHRWVLATVKSAAVIAAGAFLAALGISSVAAQEVDTATPLARPTPPSYVIHVLGVLPGDNVSVGQGVNDAGSVVGYSVGASGLRAFHWDRPTRALSQLTTSFPNSVATAIAGGHGATAYAVGFEQESPDQSSHRNAVIWIAPPTSGAIVLEAPGSPWSVANGVNDFGVAVGVRRDPDPNPDTNKGSIAVIWSPDGSGGYARTDIALLPNHIRASAADIDNNGIVVGVSEDRDVGVQRAFLRLLNGSVVELAPAPGDMHSRAEAVSDVFTTLGNRFVYVAGSTFISSIGGFGGVRWTVNVDTGAVVDQTLLSLDFVVGVNGAGDVAGGSVPSHPNDLRFATLWQGGSYITLEPPTKQGRANSSAGGLARTASSPTYVAGGAVIGRGNSQTFQAVVWDVN